MFSYILLSARDVSSSRVALADSGAYYKGYNGYSLKTEIICESKFFFYYFNEISYEKYDRDYGPAKQQIDLLFYHMGSEKSTKEGKTEENFSLNIKLTGDRERSPVSFL